MSIKNYELGDKISAIKRHFSGNDEWCNIETRENKYNPLIAEVSKHPKIALIYNSLSYEGGVTCDDLASLAVEVAEGARKVNTPVQILDFNDDGEGTSLLYLFSAVSDKEVLTQVLKAARTLDKSVGIKRDAAFLRQADELAGITPPVDR